MIVKQLDCIAILFLNFFELLLFFLIFTLLKLNLIIQILASYKGHYLDIYFFSRLLFDLIDKYCLTLLFHKHLLL